MYPFTGYQLKLDVPTSFTYNEGDDPLSRVLVNDRDNVFDLNIHDYENNGSMTVALYHNDERIDSHDYMLAAFNQDECVGYTEGMVFPLDGNVVFPLMVYGNEGNVPLTFKVYDMVTDSYFDIDEKMIFTVDMHLGNGFNPVMMNIADHPSSYSIGDPYPNPFNPSVNFNVELSSQAHVKATIYNIAGQELATIHDGLLSGKTHKMTWIADGYASGIYFIKVMVDNHVATNKKIILLK